MPAASPPRQESPSCVNYSGTVEFLAPSRTSQATETINASIIYPFETEIVPTLKILPISWKAIFNQTRRCRAASIFGARNPSLAASIRETRVPRAPAGSG